MRQRDNVTLLNQVDESGMITVTSSFNRNVWTEIQGKLTTGVFDSREKCTSL